MQSTAAFSKPTVACTSWRGSRISALLLSAVSCLLGCAPPVPAVEPNREHAGNTSNSASNENIENIENNENNEKPTRTAAESSASDASERLTLSVGARTVRDAHFDGTELLGINHDVAHFEDGYRGNSPSGFLFLSEHSPGVVAGVNTQSTWSASGFQGGQTKFDYHQNPSGHVHASGRWGTWAFSLDMDRNQIKLVRHLCTQTYRRVDASSTAFSGTSDCFRKVRGGIVLRVPESFFDRPAGEQVVFLSSFLL